MALKKSCNTISMIFTTLISDISQYGPPSLSPGMGLFTGTPEIIAGRRAQLAPTDLTTGIIRRSRMDNRSPCGLTS